ncbi:MAG: hypothetical protein RL096_879, partial [Actinomycetota bacterium]
MNPRQRNAGPFHAIDRATPEQMHRRAWWLIALTLFVPGSAQLVAGNRKLARVGISATLGFWALIVFMVLLGLINKSWVIWLATLPV